MREGDEWTSEAGAALTYTNVTSMTQKSGTTCLLDFCKQLIRLTRLKPENLELPWIMLTSLYMRVVLPHRVEGFKGDKLVYSDEYSAVVDEHPYINSFPKWERFILLRIY